MHPVWPCCENSEYPDIPAFSRLAERAPQRPKLRTYFFVNPKLGHAVNTACLILSTGYLIWSAGAKQFVDNKAYESLTRQNIDYEKS